MLISEVSYLSCWPDSFPDTEVADDPAQDEAQRQFPPQPTHLLDPTRDL